MSPSLSKHVTRRVASPLGASQPSQSLSWATNSPGRAYSQAQAQVQEYYPSASSTSPSPSTDPQPKPTYNNYTYTYMPPRPKRLIIAITGATGTIYGVRLLQILRQLHDNPSIPPEEKVETHLILSKWALATLKYELPPSIFPLFPSTSSSSSSPSTNNLLSQIHSLATGQVYTSPRDVSAPPASGSFLHDGMIVCPCSMKTLAAIRHGFCDDLISRAADVTLKEPDRKLMLVVRETPLSDVHLENMLGARRAGAIIFPPVPAWYNRPKGLMDLVDQSCGRMLDGMGVSVRGFERWEGFQWGGEGKNSREEAAA